MTESKAMRTHRRVKARWMGRFIQALKAAPCTDCGTAYPAPVMDFDHICGEKLRGIGQMWTYSPALIMAELIKCDVVCANCHRMRTWRQKNGLPPGAEYQPVEWKCLASGQSLAV